MKNYAKLLVLPLCLLIFFVAACGSSPDGQTTNGPLKAAPATLSMALHSNGCFSRYGDSGGQVHVSDFLWGRFDSCNGQITLSTSGKWSFHQVRWSRPGLSETQFSFDGAWTIFQPASAETVYTFKVQGCNHNVFGTDCSLWDTVTFATYNPGECHPGYVWRGAFDSDHVCVIPATRAQAAYDNSQASSRVNPQGAYGPTTCLQGFVWRGTVASDHVCVTPNVRSQVMYDNAHAAERVYS
ncbi:MAG: hypothetical protein H0U76_28795 [Ktedonobacteraceae bacterium]|nr:hypothetical protein [Ktedonobacteraceae bacterium]